MSSATHCAPFFVCFRMLFRARLHLGHAAHHAPSLILEVAREVWARRVGYRTETGEVRLCGWRVRSPGHSRFHRPAPDPILGAEYAAVVKMWWASLVLSSCGHCWHSSPANQLHMEGCMWDPRE